MSAGRNTKKQPQSKFQKSIDDFFFRVESAFDKSGFLNSIRQGFKLIIPIFLIGALALLILNLPIPGYKPALQKLWNGSLFNLLLFVHNGTFGVASLFVVLSVGYKYSVHLSRRQHSIINLMGAFTALVSYFAFIGLGFGTPITGFIHVNNVFIALLTALLAPRLFFVIYRLSEKYMRRFYVGGDIDFTTAVTALIPMAVTGLAFSLVTILINLAGYDNLQALFIRVASLPFEYLGKNLGSGLLSVFMQTLFWFFGIHGGNVFNSITVEIFSGGGVSKTFLDVFVLMGGGGATLCLLIALLAFSKNRRNKLITRSAAVPMIFGINETLLFGLPVVLNPIFLLPFLLTPMVLTLTSFAAMSLGIIPEVSATAEIFWTSPVFLSGWLYAGGVKGMLVQLFNLIVGTAIYAPFVFINDRLEKRKFEKYVQEMTQVLRRAEDESVAPLFFERTDYLYSAATQFAKLLRRDIERDKINMYYQPLVDENNRVVSAEALLRWGSEKDIFYYPPLVVSLAKEDGTYDALTKCIVSRVLNDLVRINKGRKSPISMSVNIQVSQLLDEKFIDWVIAETKQRDIPAGRLTLEITEESALHDKPNLKSVFDRLGHYGIKVSLDDFGMGHTSILYLQEKLFDSIKLDGSLTKSMLQNQRSYEIVESIVKLGTSFNMGIIAEFVETQEQRDALLKMGCKTYQGWLFSPAIDIDRFEVFADAMNSEGTADIVIPGI